MHLKMLSAEVICCKKLPNITDQLSIEANSVDPEQTAPTVCHRGYLNISADDFCCDWRIKGPHILSTDGSFGGSHRDAL